MGYIVRPESDGRDLIPVVAVIAVIIVCMSVAACFLSPLAFVAETFQYDVLRALNTPLILNRAQKFFGQQFLNHLHTLDWGLRFGGQVLNTRIVVSICMACFL